MTYPALAIEPAAWHGYVQEFLDEPSDALIAILEHRYPATQEQINAWVSTVRHFRQALEAIIRQQPEAARWYLALEYELPREGGRRPDVCVLTAEALAVFEVKDSAAVTPAAYEQVRGYVRDLKEYHSASHALDVRGYLFVTRTPLPTWTQGNITIFGAQDLERALRTLPPAPPTGQQVRAWLEGSYHPLPSLVQAAKFIFDHEPLPHIRRAAGAGIPQALARLHHLGARSRREKEHHLVLLSGSPGAGKTLVGLQLVHDLAERDRANAVFLSGNGPLVEVLQYALKSKVFVQDVHRFMKEHGIKNLQPIDEHTVVFDEAQRAWDREKVAEWYLKNHRISHSYSEPETFIQIMSRRPGGALLLGLVGYGQEIHNGEESGVGQWEDAILASDRAWTVHCAPRLAPFFRRVPVQEHSELDLTVPLRAHAASSIHLWVEHLLGGRLLDAARAARDVKQQGFALYVADDLHLAKEFLAERYADEPLKTYGLLSSSKARNLPDYGLENGFKSPAVLSPGRVGPWFYGRGSVLPACRALEKIATEFQCQGLELDGSLVAWGADFTWDGNAWVFPSRGRLAARNPFQLRKNSYRVLLTRARDGLVVFCPPGSEMNQTLQALLGAGMEPLPT